MNIIAEDIWKRVVRKSRGWGLNPTWALLGDEKKFGKLVVEFENGKWGVTFNIYIYNRPDLEVEIQKAIDNHEEFNRIGTELLHEQWNYNPQGLYK